MAANSIEAAIDVLESIHCKFPEWKSSQLGELKVQLRFLRTFYMCGRKWGNGVDCESTIEETEDTVHKHSLKLQSLCLRLRGSDERVTFDARRDLLLKGVSEFLFCTRHLICQEMEELYKNFSDGSLQTSSSCSEDELTGVIDSLLHNLQDFLKFPIRELGGGLTYEMEKLEENVRFLKNFILLAKFRGLEHWQMRELLTHIDGLIINAAFLAFQLRYDNSYLTMLHDIRQLSKRILPIESHVCGIYVGVLQASKLSLSSHHPTLGSHRSVLGDFVVFLRDLLWNPLCSHKCFRDIFNHQMQKLYGGLIFLGTILREHRNTFDDDQLFEKMCDLIEVVICEAGTIICYLLLGENEVGLAEKLKFLFLDLEEKFKLIKAEEERQKYPLKSALYFPQTNLLGFIDFVSEKMRSVSLYEADSVTLAKDRFETVHDNLVFLRSFLVDVMMQCDQNEEVHTLRIRVAAAVYEIEFVIDSLMAGDALQNLVVLLDTIAEEIKLIEADASKTCQMANVKNIAKAYSKTPLAAGEIPVFNKLFVGLDDEVEKIIDRLTRGRKQLDIVSIVGMPGLGKTTLAKKLYFAPSIVFHFHVRSWCYISQVFNQKSSLLEILSGLDNNFADNHLEMHEDDLAHKLYQHLKGKRYLIILDDVWDVATWNNLSNSFPDDANGSRILLTSRHHNVALQIKPDREPHDLRTLTNDESWELLQKKMFYGDVHCPPALVALGKEIAQHCKGLPLMILIVAGILSNTEQDAWVEIADSLRKGTLSTTEQCMKTLELSYLHLPDHLKPCFLYFGAFQEDQQILVRELLWLWIGEGFVKKTETQCLEVVAEGYIMELIQRNLVMVVKQGSRGRVKSCVLHDLLLDFCKAKCKEEHFLHCLREYELGTSIEPNILYRLHLHHRKVEDFAESISVLCPHLRTLFFIVDDDDGKRNYGRHWYHTLYKICQSKLLRVLDLKGIHIGPFFPREIEPLIHLRYLALYLCNSEITQGTTLTIPSSIVNFSKLETLTVGGWMLHVSLPDTFWNMKNLRHLCTTRSVYWMLPTKNSDQYPSNLENLETLSTVQFSCGQTMMEAVREFPNIRRLKCYLVRAGADCKILTLDFMSRLESLTIFKRYKEIHDMHFEFPQNLKKLVLSNSGIPWSKISIIDELPNLEVLKLLENAFIGENWEMMEEGKFPKLKYLKLAELDLARWTAWDDNFPPLEKLVLERCMNLEELPSCLADTFTLQMIEVCGCKSVVDSIEQIQETQIEMGNAEVLKIIFQASPSFPWLHRYKARK